MNAFFDKWKRITNAKRDLEMRRWFLRSSGNLSVRVCDDPLTFLITADEADRRNHDDEEFIAVNIRGEKVFKESIDPSSEVLIHSLLYQQTRAGCVLHIHTVDNNIISEIYGDVGEVVFSSQGNRDIRLPIIDRGEALSIVGLYKEYAHNDTGAVLVRNHGITVWGRTVEEAMQLLENMEFLISYQVKLLMIQGQKNSVI